MDINANPSTNQMLRETARQMDEAAQQKEADASALRKQAEVLRLMAADDFRARAGGNVQQLHAAE
jgi:hypothetical protein